MPANRKQWILAPYDCELQFLISEQLKISPVLAQICINRGCISPEQVEEFLNICPTQIHSPFAFANIDKAVGCILHALDNKEKILIYGDYDVDGITGTSLLYLYLKSRGAHVGYYIPDRMEEGYGLNEEAIYWAFREQYRIIITVDCGISSLGETALANSLGLKIVITDHHQPPAILPEAVAVINPKVRECHYPFPDLAGVGVAWKLAQALHIQAGLNTNDEVVLSEYLDLVCLGTIADVVSLTGENRAIVDMGLKRMASGERPGIRALLSVTKLDQKQLSSGQISFIIAPRLNAAGRLASARTAVELLTAHEYQDCLIRAIDLDKENARRQAVEGEIYEQAVDMIQEKIDLEEDLVIVLASHHWHAGVIGIVASRLVEKYYRPVVLIALEGELGKGSARSVEQFDICFAFAQCQEFLLQFGGHKLAAGLKLKEENIEGLRKAINNYAKTVLKKNNLVPIVKVDIDLDISKDQQNYLHDIERLAPFGQGNPHPVFAFRNLKILEAKAVGSSLSHLKIKMESGGHLVEGIGFNLAHHLSWLNTGSRVDVAAVLERNQWNGWDKVQLVLRDIQPHPIFALIHSKTFHIDAQRKSLSDLPFAQEMNTRVSFALPLYEGRALWHRAAVHNWVTNKNKTIVLLSCPSQLWSEYMLAEMDLGKWGIAVSKGESFLPQEEKTLIWQIFTSGLSQVLITTPEFLQAQNDYCSVLSHSLVVVALGDPFDSVISEGHFLQRCKELLQDGHGNRLLITTISDRKGHLNYLEKTFDCKQTYCNIKSVYPSIIDSRGIYHREEYLLDLLTRGEKCLVYGAFRYQVAEIIRMITKAGVPADCVAECHGYQRPWQHQIVKKKLQHQTIKIVVTTRHFFCETDGLFDHVIFFHCPQSMFDFFHLTGWTGSCKLPQVHLLFNQRDVELVDDVLKTDYPDRDLLGKLYKIVKAWSSPGNKISGTKEEILRKLRTAGMIKGKDGTFDVWLSIMTELGLIKTSMEGNRYCLEFLNYGNKCNLEDSFIYREGLREKKAFGFCHKVALSGNFDPSVLSF